MLNIKFARARRSLDQAVSPYRAAAARPAPRSGWLRAIRQAVGMTSGQFAARLGVARQSADDIEASEAAGTVTLNTLRRAAAALDCHLVYAIVPNAASLDELVDRRAREIARRELAAVNQTMLLEDQAAKPGSLEQRTQDYIAEHLRDRDLWAS